MAYNTPTGTYVPETIDYVYQGKTEAEHSITSREGSVPGSFQDEYAAGYLLGAHFRKYLSAINF